VVDEASACSLIEFLRDDDDASTRQIALQCIQSIFRRAPPRVDVEPLLLRLRVLAEHILVRDVLINAQIRSLAANVVGALSALAPSELPLLAATVRELGKPGVRALVETKWRSMMDARLENEGEASAFREALGTIAR
jgi:hypothetical protein